MRQIATLSDFAVVQRLADYLLTLDVETRLEQAPEGWIVWVCDEDRVPQAREVLPEFLKNPTDARYAFAPREAAARRRQEEEVEEAFRKRQVRVRERWDEGREAPRVLTYVLVTLCVAVGLATNLGGQSNDGQSNNVLRRLLVSEYVRPTLPEIQAGQLWRVVTPIFLHFGMVHLLFNMLMLLDLGGRVESRIGTWRYLAIVLVIAVVSNLAQYYLGPFSLKEWRKLFEPSPLFGGMSGVVYGLFGYVWMKSRFDPASGLQMSASTVVILMAWLAIGLTGFLVEAIANGAHAGGLIVGLVIGYAPHLWQRLRRD